MSSTDGSILLTADDARQMHKLLSDCRHNVNNYVGLIMSAMELAQLKPDATPKMIQTAVDQSRKITEEVARYSTEFERLVQTARSRS